MAIWQGNAFVRVVGRDGSAGVKIRARSVYEIFEDFVGHLSIEKNYALNTISSYKRDLLKFSSFLSKKEVLDFKMIDPDVLNIFVMELRHSNTSGKSIKRYLSSIRVFFNFLIEVGEVQTNQLF